MEDGIIALIEVAKSGTPVWAEMAGDWLRFNTLVGIKLHEDMLILVKDSIAIRFPISNYAVMLEHYRDKLRNVEAVRFRITVPSGMLTLHPMK